MVFDYSDYEPWPSLNWAAFLNLFLFYFVFIIFLDVAAVLLFIPHTIANKKCLCDFSEIIFIGLIE